MDARPTRPPRRTGPIELRDFGPNGHRLGTPDDCYDGSPWELHRGELVQQMGSKDIHGITMALLAALFRVHAREGHTVLADIYCDLTDEQGPSLRAPDVVVVSDLVTPRNDAYRGTPLLAVEIRGTQSKKYLDDKVKLYLEHDWPEVWLVHAERHEVEVLRRGVASVVYRPGTEVPMIPALDKYGLTALPVTAFFDQREVTRYTDEWVQKRAEARARGETLLEFLDARGLDLPETARARITACTDVTMLKRWLVLAATAASASAFVDAMGERA
ncbi:Uma2 family endonuclease [Polyangium jinanense]|uniref:Uma2 family endonuclease n=1 Tax=Polyangium jinanense TaxID=2829994 RepID=UPI00233FE906|nr:Uma2 family endonuclease [Polyangium jinanense]MDC3953217.1 Uma2 family endonuclease [Polyangium jinanense]